MKQKLLFLILVLCAWLPMTAQTTPLIHVTQADALDYAKQLFKDVDADYFAIENGTSKAWKIFVDPEPMRGWEHDCYLISVDKQAPLFPKVLTVSIDSLRTPPSGNYIPVSVKNRYGDKSSSKPAVRKQTLTNDASIAAQRTYAIILNGGISLLSNHERYWNDCSFIYQTLVNRYGVPKDNIYPLMSDGTNPDFDIRCTAGGYMTQSLDLDFDGENEIKLAATKANVRSTLSSLASKMEKDDHLFIYVIDHGGTNDYNTNSYICLWGNESLYDYELAEMLTPFTSKLVNVNVVLGQCFSGGFIDNLTKTGCVVAAASKGSESSWACSKIPYDEFVYRWTCAVNGADHLGQAIKADTDNNGRVTMDEAFLYAKRHDIKDEHPQYVSTPRSVGEDLAFNHLAPSIDLYLKDNPEDTGKEPNMTTDKFWISPSIWIRNKADGIYEHENPYYSEDHPAATIYVRVSLLSTKNGRG